MKTATAKQIVEQLLEGPDDTIPAFPVTNTPEAGGGDNEDHFEPEDRVYFAVYCRGKKAAMSVEDLASSLDLENDGGGGDMEGQGNDLFFYSTHAEYLSFKQAVEADKRLKRFVNVDEPAHAEE